MPLIPANSYGAGGDVSRVAQGSLAAPGAGANLASIAAVAAGVYLIEWQYVITGAVEALPNNLTFLHSNVVQILLPTGAGVAAVYNGRIPTAVVTGSFPIGLQAAAAATALTVYTGWITATRIA